MSRENRAPSSLNPQFLSTTTSNKTLMSPVCINSLFYLLERKRNRNGQWVFECQTYTIAIGAPAVISADASAKRTKRPVIDACLQLLDVDRHMLDWKIQTPMHDLDMQLVATAGVIIPTRSVVMKSTGAFIFVGIIFWIARCWC